MCVPQSAGGVVRCTGSTPVPGQSTKAGGCVCVLHSAGGVFRCIDLTPVYVQSTKAVGCLYAAICWWFF